MDMKTLHTALAGALPLADELLAVAFPAEHAAIVAAIAGIEKLLPVMEAGAEAVGLTSVATVIEDAEQALGIEGAAS